MLISFEISNFTMSALTNSRKAEQSFTKTQVKCQPTNTANYSYLLHFKVTAHLRRIYAHLGRAIYYEDDSKYSFIHRRRRKAKAVN